MRDLYGGIVLNWKLLLNMNNLHEKIQDLINDSRVKKLHFLGHGLSGCVLLGQYKFNVEAISNMEFNIRDDLNIFIWSCKAGQSIKGRLFLQELANKTGANVYGSSNLVGNHVLGGSWELDLVVSPQ